IENHSANERFDEGANAGAAEVMEEAHRSRRIRSSHRQTEQRGGAQHPPHVVPVKQLEPPGFINFLCVRPTAPAQHAEEHQQERGRVSEKYSGNRPEASHRNRIEYSLFICSYVRLRSHARCASGRWWLASLGSSPRPRCHLKSSSSVRRCTSLSL